MSSFSQICNNSQPFGCEQLEIDINCKDCVGRRLNNNTHHNKYYQDTWANDCCSGQQDISWCDNGVDKRTKKERRNHKDGCSCRYRYEKNHKKSKCPYWKGDDYHKQEKCCPVFGGNDCTGCHVQACGSCGSGCIYPATIDAFGIDSTGLRLVRLSTLCAGSSFGSVAITGLQPGETVLAIALRPANGVLYAVGSSSRLYVLDRVSGVATAVSQVPFVPALSGLSFAASFNPTVDRLRIVSGNGQNLRINPDTGVVAAVDVPISAASSVVGLAYTNSVAGATFTTLFDIDANNSTLAIQNPPNLGTLTTVGSLGLSLEPNTPVGFSIRPGTNGAFATFVQSGVSGLYSIDLVSGQAKFVSQIVDNIVLRAIAVLPCRRRLF